MSKKQSKISAASVLLGAGVVLVLMAAGITETASLGTAVLLGLIGLGLMILALGVN